jgi:carbon monoxide dehydrogenase subunit G
MLRFEGDRDFPLPPETLWARLTDARFLVACIPDVDKVNEVGPDHASLVLRPSFAFVRGTLEVTLKVADAIPPTGAKVFLHSKGIGSSSSVEAVLALQPHEAGSRVHWTAEVKELGGLLKMVPSGLIRGAAQKVVNDAWTAVEKKFSEPD